MSSLPADRTVPNNAAGGSTPSYPIFPMKSRLPNRRVTTLACLSALAMMGAHLSATAQSQNAKEATVTLPDVKVTGTSESDNNLPAVAPGGKTATGARLGILGNANVMDAAFSVKSYTSELAQDQIAMSLGDVLLNDPSVQYTTNGGHLIENFTIRGFGVTATDIGLNGMYGILPISHVPMEFIERVEVLNGPNAMLGGISPSGGVGGMINLVTKRAGSKPITEFTTTYSSKSYFQQQVDLGRRFGDDDRWGIRFNGVYGNGETGVSGQKKGRTLGALALDYQGDDFNLQLDAYSNREDIENGSPAQYSMAKLGYLVSPPDSSTNMFRGTRGYSRTSGFLMRGEYQFNDKTSAYAAFGAANSVANGLQFGTRVVVNNEDGDATGYVYNINSITHTRTAELGLKTQLQTGPVSHKVTMALNQMTYKYWLSNTANTGWAQNIYDPVSPDVPVGPNGAALNTDNVYKGVALADTMGIFDDKLLVTLGARYQSVEQKVSDSKKSTITPAFGVVYKPWGDDVALYANYIEGLSPGATVGTGYANAGEQFSPYRTKQGEIGLKIRSDSMLNTFSLFRIEQPSVVTNADTNTQSVDGEQRNQGFEWSFSGQLTNTVSLLGGFTYTDARYHRNTEALQGNTVYGVPKTAITLGAEWRTPVQGLSLNGRVTRVGEQYLNSTNTIKLPAWYRFDVGAAYATRIQNTPVTFRAYVDNVFDHDYWSGVFNDNFAMLSAPRTFRLSATIAF